jgi:chromosomal replication initiation ATPase DnaA
MNETVIEPNRVRPFRGVPQKKGRKAERLIQTVADEYRIPVSDLYIKSRAPKHSEPRAVAMSLLRSILKLSFSVISRHFEYSHPSAVISACRRMDPRVLTDNDLRDTIIGIINVYKNEDQKRNP